MTGSTAHESWPLLQQQTMLTNSSKDNQLSVRSLHQNAMRGTLRRLRLSSPGISPQPSRKVLPSRALSMAECPTVIGPRMEVSQLCKALSRADLSRLGPERVWSGTLEWARSGQAMRLRWLSTRSTGRGRMHRLCALLLAPLRNLTGGSMVRLPEPARTVRPGLPGSGQR